MVLLFGTGSEGGLCCEWARLQFLEVFSLGLFDIWHNCVLLFVLLLLFDDLAAVNLEGDLHKVVATLAVVRNLSRL